MRELCPWSFECADFFSNLDVGHVSYKKNVPIETFNILFESTQNEQQYSNKFSCTEVRERSMVMI